jgi:hypothetical protein
MQNVETSFFEIAMFGGALMSPESVEFHSVLLSRNHVQFISIHMSFVQLERKYLISDLCLYLDELFSQSRPLITS